MQHADDSDQEAALSVKQRRAKQLELYAASFCETVELLCLLAVMFLAPYAPAYRQAWANRTQTDSAMELVARDTNGIYFDVQVLMVRLVNALVADSADQASATRVHVTGIDPHSFDTKPQTAWDKDSRALMRPTQQPVPYSLLHKIAPKPFRPRGVQWVDIPAASYATMI